MDELKALISVISKNKVKQIDVLGNSHSEDTQVQKLYEQIVAGEIETQEDIEELFFNGNTNSSQYAKRLEQKLKNRLLNTIFFIDINQKGFNAYNKAYYSCYKEMNAVKILIGRFARKAAIPLAERTLKKAISFELTDIVVILAQELRLHFGAIEGDIKKFWEYNLLVEKYADIQVAELKVESLYAQLRLHFNKAKSIKPEIVKDAKNFSEQIAPLVKKYPSYKLRYLAFLIDATYYEIIPDYENLLKTGEEALLYFEEKGQMVPITSVFSFSVRVLICHIKLTNYEKAREIIPKCFSYVREGSNNWFLLLEYCIMLSIHSKNFQEAYTYYKKAAEHSEFRRLYEGISEHWIIHEAYIYYLISVHRINPETNNPVRQFRLARFLNEVPSYVKDKRGANISIIILQILFLLQQKKYGEIIDKMESLQTYTQRYLRRDDTYRSNCFIQMLLTLSESGFHKKAVLRKAEKYTKKLQELPIHLAKQSVEIEIIPYEILWEFILESLDEKWH